MYLDSFSRVYCVLGFLSSEGIIPYMGLFLETPAAQLVPLNSVQLLIIAVGSINSCFYMSMNNSM